MLALITIRMNLGKTLTDPLFLFFLIVAFAALLRLIPAKSIILKFRRFTVPILGFMLLGLFFLSTEFGTSCLEDSLENGRSYDERVPVEAIVVLAGGGNIDTHGFALYFAGHTMARVLTGVGFWKKNQSAYFVVSGEEPDGPPEYMGRETLTMAELAMAYGVPTTRILRDTKSQNTWQHPKNVSQLHGITSKTKIGLVTSSWHMRRALKEFEKYFTAVYPYPYRLFKQKNSSFFQQWTPQAKCLLESTTLLHEWIGLAFYSTKSILRID